MWCQDNRHGSLGGKSSLMLAKKAEYLLSPFPFPYTILRQTVLWFKHIPII